MIFRNDVNSNIFFVLKAGRPMTEAATSVSRLRSSVQLSKEIKTTGNIEDNRDSKN